MLQVAKWAEAALSFEVGIPKSLAPGPSAK
jgi:hypothetical protein